MKRLEQTLSRRRFLRGTLKGGAVSVGLPLLNVFLNDNGTAYADGMPIPLRFGTWSWGLGMSESIFVPKKIGANVDLPEEIAALAPVQEHLNLYTNFHVFKDDAPNLCHHSGWVVLRSGIAPTARANLPGETIDVSIARQIGNATRFRSLSATATGDVRDSFSYEGGNSVNTPEWSPLRFYQRLFGEGFQDPNASTFTPDPKVLVRQSALSAVQEEARKLEKSLGSEDRARLDQYFTGLRDLERRFDLQLTKPDPREACVVLEEPMDLPTGLDADLVATRHRMMTDLMLWRWPATRPVCSICSMLLRSQQRRSRDMTSRITRRLMKKRWTRSWAISPIPPGIRVAPWRNGPITCRPSPTSGRGWFSAGQLVHLCYDGSVLCQAARDRWYPHVFRRHCRRPRQDRSAHQWWRLTRLPARVHCSAADGTRDRYLGRQEQHHFKRNK